MFDCHIIIIIINNIIIIIIIIIMSQHNFFRVYKLSLPYAYSIWSTDNIHTHCLKLLFMKLSCLPKY